MKKIFNNPLGTASVTHIIGTPEALSFCPIGQTVQSDMVVKCYSTSEEVYKDVFSWQYTAELSIANNPSTGCRYALVDHFSNTTYFERDKTYEDWECLYRYSLTPSVINSFNQTFLESNLQENQFAVACTAFSLQELGCGFRIIVHSDEVALVRFCKKLGWTYKIVNLR